MDGHISFHNIVPIPVWRTDGWASTLPTDVHPHHFISALDDVYRSAAN